MIKSKDAAGISMMEMILYIGIMTVVGAGVFRLYAEANEKAKRVEIQNQIPSVIKQTNILYAGRHINKCNTDEDKPCIVVDKNLNDSNYLSGKGVKLTHPWSSAADAITVTAKAANGVITRPFMEIQVKYLSKASCVWLVSAMVGTGLCTTGTKVTAAPATDCNPDPKSAVTQCNKTDNTNIVFVRAQKE